MLTALPMASPIAQYTDSSSLDGEAQIFALSTKDFQLLRQEYAGNTKDFAFIPYGPSLTGDEQEGVVTPDMFDSVLNAAAYDMEMDMPGSSQVFGFSLYSPYQELSRDCKISAALQTRIMNSVQRDWIVTPASGDALDIKAADMVRSHLMALETHSHEDEDYPYAVLEEVSGFDQMQAQFLDALLMGFAAGEIIWDKDGSEKFPRAIKPKKQHRWSMYLSQRGWEPRLLTRGDRSVGVPVPAKKFLFYRHRPEHGPFGKGLGHELYFPTAYKRRTLELFLIHGQRYASPTIFIEVPPNASDDITAAARAAVGEVGVEAAITLPQGMGIHQFEGKVGNNSTYEKLLSYLDGQGSQVILGQTGTLDQQTDGGSRAQDEVADNQTVRLAKQDTDAFCAYLGRTLISWDVNENMHGARAPKLSRPFPELEQTKNEKEMAERDEKIVLFTGRRIVREQVEERYDVQLEDELIAAPPPSTLPPAQNPLNDLDKTEQGAELSEQPGKSQAAPIHLAATPIGEEDEWAEAALEEMAGTLADFQAAVKATVEQADDEANLDGAFNKLLRSGIIRRRLARAIAPALSVAFGVGVLDVQEELDEGGGVSFAEGLNPVMGFTAAIEAVGAKLPVPTAKWNALQGADQAWAFTVAGIMQADVLTDIQAAVKKSIEGGGSFKGFKNSFDEAYARTGASPLAPWRARLVLNQNVKNSYQAGRYAQQEAPDFQRNAPYREYRHGYSDTPRASHLALDGFVARADDEIWESIYPPNGFNCSCRVFAMTKGAFERGGYSLSDPLPGGDGASPKVVLPNGKEVAVADEGFGGAPSAARTRESAIALAKFRTPPDKWEALGIADKVEEVEIAPKPERNKKAVAAKTKKAVKPKAGALPKVKNHKDFDKYFRAHVADLTELLGKDRLELKDLESRLSLHGVSKKDFDKWLFESYDDTFALENDFSRSSYAVNGLDRNTLAILRKERFEPDTAVSAWSQAKFAKDWEDKRAKEPKPTKTYQELQAQARERFAKQFQSIESLNKAVADADKEFDRVADDYDVAYTRGEAARKKADKALEQAGANYRLAKEARTKQTKAALESVRKDLLTQRNQAEAKAWADSIDVWSEVTELYDEGAVRNALKEFWLISNGKAGNLSTLRYADFVSRGQVIVPKKRAYAVRETNMINVGLHQTDGETDLEKFTKTLYHEMAHHVEFGTIAGADPRYGAAASAWRDALATSTEQKKLSELTGISAYRDSETALPGKYYNPYLGKVYDDTSTEVVAMGMEHLSTPERMLELYEKQPELLEFVLGVAIDD